MIKSAQRKSKKLWVSRSRQGVEVLISGRELIHSQFLLAKRRIEYLGEIQSQRENIYKYNISYKIIKTWGNERLHVGCEELECHVSCCDWGCNTGHHGGEEEIRKKSNSTWYPSKLSHKHHKNLTKTLNLSKLWIRRIFMHLLRWTETVFANICPILPASAPLLMVAAVVA